MSIDDRNPHELATFGHEPVETDVRAVWRTGAVIAAVVIATYLLILGMMKWFLHAEGSPAANAAAITEINWPQQNPLQQLRGTEQKLLDNYGWIDREAGIARIPVDRAIEIISQNGLPLALQGSSAPGQNSAQQSNGPAVAPENAAGNGP